MNRLIRDGFDGNLLPPAALVLLAKQENVPFEDLLDGLLQSIRKAITLFRAPVPGNGSGRVPEYRLIGTKYFL